MATLRERLWIWGHKAGSYDGLFGLSGSSTMTIAEAGDFLGIPNAFLVVFANEPQPQQFGQYAHALQGMKNVVWSIVGDASSVRNDGQTDLDEVVKLSTQAQNVSGAIMDDFFGNFADGKARYEPAEVARFRERLHAAPRPLELWVVVYDHDLVRDLQPYLRVCDQITFWIWRAAELRHLQAHMDKLSALSEGVPISMGCYLWDFGEQQPMPAALLEEQCRLGREWLHSGKIANMIFVGNCLGGMPLETLDWLRTWIEAHGDEEVGKQPLRHR